jgi:hypothetical protein
MTSQKTKTAQTQNERMKAYYLKNKEDILQKRKNSQNWLARVK